MDQDLIYKIAFSQIHGLIGNTAREMLARVGSPKAFFEFTESELTAITGASAQILSQAYRDSVLEEARKEANFVKVNNIRTYFIGDADYPLRLSFCDDAPAMIYTLGDVDLNAKHTIGIVGTRHATQYGIDFINQLVADLAKMVPGIVVFSGLAYGSDIAAHKAAMAAGTPTAAVLAHGLNTIYPAEHRNAAIKMLQNNGGLITEYVSTSRIYRKNFLSRNRIVAALSDALVVSESDYRGGSMSTAKTAFLYNREVFALPGRVTDIYSRGANALIANNTAHLITNATDLTKQMGWSCQAAVEEQPRLFDVLTPEQQKVYEYISAHPDDTTNEICVALDIPYHVFSDLIFKMEMMDVISCLPGGRYSISK